MTQHAIDRIRERYGVELRPSDVTALEADIEAGRSVLVMRLRSGHERQMVRFGDVAVAVVFHTIDRVIVTALAPEHLTGREGARRRDMQARRRKARRKSRQRSYA